jgi:hypothetical protein
MMGTWTAGEPYTDPEPDDVTDEVNTDRATETFDAAVAAALDAAPNLEDSADATVPTPTGARFLIVEDFGEEGATVRAAARANVLPTTVRGSMNTNFSPTSETSVFSSAFQIPANTLAVGSQCRIRIVAGTVNLGTAQAMTWRFKLGGVTFSTYTTASIPGLNGGAIVVEAVVECTAVSPSPALNVSSVMTWTLGTTPSAYPLVTISSPALTYATSSAIAVDLTAQAPYSAGNAAGHAARLTVSTW